MFCSKPMEDKGKERAEPKIQTGPMLPGRPKHLLQQQWSKKSDAEKVGKLKEKVAEGSLDLIKYNGMTPTVRRSMEEHLSPCPLLFSLATQGSCGDKAGDHLPHTKL